MYVLMVATALCTCVYVLLLLYYLRHWQPAPASKRPVMQELPTCSVIVAARNEEHTIGHCLHALTTQTYPEQRFEILVVNDGSEDNTAGVVSQFPGITRLNTQNNAHGKKHALNTGIDEARGEIIVITDADCVAGPGWLQALAEAFDDTTQMVTGPVFIANTTNAFERFQALELAGLALATAAGIHSGLHHLANGANMAFRKTAFHAIGGFSGHLSFASGDDLFLVQSLALSSPDSIRYVAHPGAIIQTSACSTWSALFTQRTRWATKVRALRERAVMGIWAFVWLTYVLIPVAVIVAIIYHPYLLLLALFLIGIIASVNYMFLRRIVRYYQMESLLRGFVQSFFRHYIYVLYIGIQGVMRRDYVWKGRKVR